MTLFLPSGTRINAEILQNAVDDLLRNQDNNDSNSVREDSSSIEAFVCGPPSMIEFVEKVLIDCGVGSVMYEKWW